mmetsp:Transcript_292/g.402  ORF Transcript_292/g.402 Transcript_292/m.402 type:complete len:134 (-) Transcript_292:89-490(-)
MRCSTLATASAPLSGSCSSWNTAYRRSALLAGLNPNGEQDIRQAILPFGCVAGGEACEAILHAADVTLGQIGAVVARHNRMSSDVVTLKCSVAGTPNVGRQMGTEQKYGKTRKMNKMSSCHYWTYSITLQTIP